MPMTFHDGERALQARLGLAERLEQTGSRMVRDFMPDQHRDFFAMLPFLIVGSLDTKGRPWASILAGQPGFVQSPDPQTLTVAARPGFGDPLAENLSTGVPLGLLGIQPETRRRNRMNGRAMLLGSAGFAVEVDQSFGNCPKYIQARSPRFVAEPETMRQEKPVLAESALLSDRAQAMVEGTDTFFLASASANPAQGGNQGVDVSHRGGKPGFVRVTRENGRAVLTVPDFSGNMLFNSFGNLQVNPRAGLLFADFATGDLLYLTGTAEVIWDGPEVAAFAGAERLMRFTLEEGRLVPGALPLRWSRPVYAPQLAATGEWPV
ncbi:MAG: pyridoxamine 5'-phosphate oxidase family protein [Rhodospirillales bacterium]|nr:pyridoxamine 5'-phosphate oxidase family protein [Rhodospirillales bacterium]